MNINYQHIKLYKNNLFIPTQQSSIKPIVTLQTNPVFLYTLIMFDPDAVGGNKIHWLITNITNNDILTGNTLIQYKGPAPPSGSGKHHYVFCLFAQDKYIANTNVKFNSRFIELNKLFEKIVFNKNNLKIKNIKYFISAPTK